MHIADLFAQMTGGRSPAPLPSCFAACYDLKVSFFLLGWGVEGMSPYLPSYSLFSHSSSSILLRKAHGQGRERSRRGHNCTPEGSPLLHHLSRLYSKPHPSQHTESLRQDLVSSPECWACQAPTSVATAEHLSPALTVLTYFCWGTLLSLRWPV